MLLGFGTTPKHLTTSCRRVHELHRGRCSDSGERLLDGGNRARGRRAAHGDVSLDAVWPGDPGGVGERGRRDAGGPLAEPALAGEHDPRLGRGRHRGHTGGAALPDRLHVAPLPDRAGARGGGVRRLHVVRDRRRGRDPDRVAQSVLVYASGLSWFPTHRRHRVARRARLSSTSSSSSSGSTCGARACRREGS